MLRIPATMASQHRLSLPLATPVQGSELQGRRAEKPPFLEFVLSRSGVAKFRMDSVRIPARVVSLSTTSCLPLSSSPDPFSLSISLSLSLSLSLSIRIPPLGFGESRVIMADFFDSLPPFLPLPRYQIRWAGDAGKSRIDEGVFIFVPQPKIYAVREGARAYALTPVQYDRLCYLCTLLKLDRPDRTFFVQVSCTILLNPPPSALHLFFIFFFYFALGKY